MTNITHTHWRKKTDNTEIIKEIIKTLHQPALHAIIMLGYILPALFSRHEHTHTIDCTIHTIQQPDGFHLMHYKHLPWHYIVFCNMIYQPCNLTLFIITSYLINVFFMNIQIDPNMVLVFKYYNKQLCNLIHIHSSFIEILGQKGKPSF